MAQPGASLRASLSPLNMLHALLTVLSLTIAFGTFDGTLFGWHPWAMSLGTPTEPRQSEL